MTPQAIWRATVLTLYPSMFPGPLGHSLAGEALASGLWTLDLKDIRDHGRGRHRAVDDTPAGGGPGLVMRPDVLAESLDAVGADARPRLLMSPRGSPKRNPIWCSTRCTARRERTAPSRA